jgi:DNA-binding transcriptional MerR regulator
MSFETWKVGDLARRSGLSVRTLHHYDEIGLLRPSRRTGSGHRLYADPDVVRLQQIKSLRQVGLSLEEIRGFLDRPDASPLRVVEMHLARLDGQIAGLRSLRWCLDAVASRLRMTEEVSVDEFFLMMEAMTMYETYYTPEQLEYLARRKEIVGEARIKEVEAEWPVLMAEVRAAMDAGMDPSSEPARALARRWMGLVEEFTGGDPGITKSLGKLYTNEATVHGLETAPMREMMEFIGKAREAGGAS